MAAKNRSDIQAEIDALLADNTTGDISPLDVRTVHETAKDSNLNLLESSAQTVAGEINYTGGLKVGGNEVNASPAREVPVFAKSDLPAPSAGVITLSANTVYLISDNVDLGTDRLQFSDGVTLRGVDSINHTLTYTGTGDMFTFPDVTARVERLTINCANGRMINFTTTSTKIFRMNDCTIGSCDRLGLMDGTDAIARFTNVSPGAITTDGLSFTGTWRSFFYEVSATTINGGSLFNLGTATFDSFYCDTVLATVNAGATLIAGAAGSANINAGGVGSVILNRTSGTGTLLSGISVDDARWEFLGNDDIADTRPDGLLSMQGNTTETTILTAGTPVLIAGTWVEERTSQMSGSAAGRLTYDGGKDATLPYTTSVSIEPVSGGTINVSAQVAVNGTVVANSKRTSSASNGNPTSITVPWQGVLSTNDYVEVFITNEDSTANLLVASAVFRIN